MMTYVESDTGTPSASHAKLIHIVKLEIVPRNICLSCRFQSTNYSIGHCCQQTNNRHYVLTSIYLTLPKMAILIHAEASFSRLKFVIIGSI